MRQAIALAAALRYEDFDDFGTTTNYRLGFNYEVNENLGVRATVNSGFKAPTPGQSNTANISTQIINGVLTNQGVIPSTSPAAVLRGGGLGPENSNNYTLGAYMTLAHSTSPSITLISM